MGARRYPAWWFVAPWRFPVLAGTIGLMIGCTPPGPAEGVWRGEIDLYGDSVPFNLEITHDGGQLRAFYLNGKERMAVEELRLEAESALRLDFPSYASALTARIQGERMVGEVRLHRRGQDHLLPFSGVHGQSWRFFPQPAAAFAEVGGRWEVTISVPSLGFAETGVALFERRGPYVCGTVQTATGDFRFLHGEMRERELHLSAFDGAGAQLTHRLQLPGPRRPADLAR